LWVVGLKVGVCSSGFWVRSLGFGVWGLGFGVWGFGLGVGFWGLWVGGLKIGVCWLGFGVWGLGFGFWGLGLGCKVSLRMSGRLSTTIRKLTRLLRGTTLSTLMKASFRVISCGEVCSKVNSQASKSKLVDLSAKRQERPS
jgi:hypothetical protein